VRQYSIPPILPMAVGVDLQAIVDQIVPQVQVNHLPDHQVRAARHVGRQADHFAGTALVGDG
jgi:hypothetical protein